MNKFIELSCSSQRESPERTFQIRVDSIESIVDERLGVVIRTASGEDIFSRESYAEVLKKMGVRRRKPSPRFQAATDVLVGKKQ